MNVTISIGLSRRGIGAYYNDIDGLDGGEENWQEENEVLGP